MNAIAQLGTYEATLQSDQVDRFTALIAEVAGQSMPFAQMPYLAPALLFSDSAIQIRLGLPVPAVSDILIQDYQAITYQNRPTLDKVLQASERRTEKGATTEFDFTLADGPAAAVAMKTALRCVPRTALLATKPAQIGDAESLANLAFQADLRICQAQTDRYVHLSGDGNPIHTNPAEAQSLGLPAPIVPGLLLVSTIQPAIAAALPGSRLVSLKCRFVAPLCVGERFSIALQSRRADRLRAYLLGDDARALALADLTFAR